MMHLFHRGIFQRASIKFGQTLLILALLLSSSGHAGAAAAASYQQIFLSLPNNNNGNSSTLYLHNPATSSAVTLVLSFSNGQSFPDMIPAGGTLIKNLSEMGLPSGATAIFNLILSSDQPVEALAEIKSSAGDRLAIIAGQNLEGAPGLTSSALSAFKIFFGPVSRESSLTLYNLGTGTATVVISFENAFGVPIVVNLPSIASASSLAVNFGTISSLPAGGVYLAVVSSDQPLIGMARNALTPLGDFELQPAFGAGSTTNFLPRALKGFDDGGGARTTRLFVANRGLIPANATLSFTNSSGLYTHSGIEIPAGGYWYGSLVAETQLSNASAWAVSVVGDQPLLLSELTGVDVPPAAASQASYIGFPGSSANVVDLPYLIRSSSAYSAFSVLNTSGVDTDVTIRYYNLNGTLVTTKNLSVSAGVSSRVNLAGVSELGSDFIGSAVLSATTSISAMADIFRTTCLIPGEVQITRAPDSDVKVGTPLVFSASASGTAPFNYAWTLNNNPVGNDNPHFSHTFAAPGWNTVGVTITNACGNAAGSLDVTILPNLPDLSTSMITVDHNNITNISDILTYTLLLRNTNEVDAALATVSDPIPPHTAYVPGSASVSDGSTVNVEGGVLSWLGTVSIVTPVIIRFQVTVVDPLPVNNTAILTDGVGGTFQLSAASTYNPGFSFTINQGDLYTNQASVNLSYTWDSTKPVTQFRLSNDGGFLSGADTSSWIPANSVSPVYNGWVLKSMPNSLLPRTVYIQFRDSGGNPLGTYQDDILFDNIPPVVAEVKIITSSPANFLARQNLSATIQVTSSDDNSGTGQVQVSHQADFDSYNTFSTSGSRVTNIPWQLQPSGHVYVRVIDRAGNVSAPTESQGPSSNYSIYLPVTLTR